MSVFVGLDIGGTKFMAAAADAQGKILRRCRTGAASSQDGVLIPAVLQQSLESDLEVLQEMISIVANGEPIAAIGAAAGGPLDWMNGIVSPLHQPHWRSVPLKSIMETRWQCPFYVDVDTNIAALGELFYGQPAPSRLLYLTLSTGLGGGFLVDGKIYRGAGGAHPEVGHQSIPFRLSSPGAVYCECGLSDCMEGLVSGNAIRRIYQKPAQALNAEEWSEVAYNLGLGLRNLAAILAPDEIRIGGGVAYGGGASFIAEASRVMENHLRIVPSPKVTLSSLGYDTALLGALAVALQGANSPVIFPHATD